MGKLKIMGKQQPPGGIPQGAFSFPNWKLKIMGKQKPPSGIPPGGFCFPIIFNLPISQIFCQIVVG